MYRIHLHYDDNIYDQPQVECHGVLEFESLDEAIKNVKRIVDIQDTFIKRNCCENPYTRIALVENKKVLVSVSYYYDKAFGQYHNRNFRKEIRGNDHIIHQIKRKNGD